MGSLSILIGTNAKRFYRNVIFPFRKLSLMLSKRVYFGVKGYADRGTEFDGDNYIGESAFLTKCHLGRGSYAADFVMLNQLNSGKYCSIGSGVCTAIGAHPVRENISTSPSFFSMNPATHLRFSDEQRFNEANGSVNIANDVWIGNRAVLMAGIEIGNGAIIGAGSIVTHSVPAYEIWAGVPARKIGQRFDDQQIMKLEALKWWDKDDKWLKENAAGFANPGELLGKI